ncbi:MAG: hypothetical protein JWO03_2176, partial [Bacteroidetes bacterium]|nr:hypothetical protein [Bacteroidota bacterium]
HLDTFCSENFLSLPVFNDVITNQENNGFVCTKMRPTHSYEYCDNNKEFMNALEYYGLVCQ